jgi:NAD(P)-dependent dehydrogenase (short-subunit alcohol dehydrogenase family)
VEQTLAGSWSVVLGASSGMGRACALHLAEAGSNIIGVHLDTGQRQQAVEELVEEVRKHGVQAHFVNDNAASPAGRERVLPEIVERVGAGGIRVVVHSLAFGTLAPFLPAADADAADGPEGEEEISQRQLDMTLSVMAHSLVYWVQDLLRAGLFDDRSRVFALTSSGTARVARSYGAVSAAKCALESHVRQLAVELAPRGVAVNAIRAGITLTPSFLRIPESRDLSERARQANPHRRLTTPEDVAEAIVLLAGARSSWLTGNVIGVDGGEILTV